MSDLWMYAFDDDEMYGEGVFNVERLFNEYWEWMSFWEKKFSYDTMVEFMATTEWKDPLTDDEFEEWKDMYRRWGGERFFGKLED